MKPFADMRVNNFVLAFEHEPDVPDVIWRTVSCSVCGRMLSKGKLTPENAPDLGVEDAIISLKHLCPGKNA